MLPRALRQGDLSCQLPTCEYGHNDLCWAHLGVGGLLEAVAVHGVLPGALVMRHHGGQGDAQHGARLQAEPGCQLGPQLRAWADI